MIAEIFALTSALILSFGTIFIRKGLEESNIVSGTLVTNIIGIIIFWVMLPFTVPLNSIDLNGILLFVLSGAMTIGFPRLLVFKGMKELGASMNASILATNPMISSFIAVLLLGENPTQVVWIGMSIVITGVVMIERSTIYQEDKTNKATRSAFIYPFGAVCLAGSGFVIRKIALNFYDEPVMGVAIGYLVSLLIYLFLSVLSRDFRGSIELSKRTFKLFWKGGLCMCFGILSIFYSFRHGDVSIVTPIFNIEPLLILLFAQIFLKKMEKITFFLFLGTIMIVTGISLITIF